MSKTLELMRDSLDELENCPEEHRSYHMASLRSSIDFLGDNARRMLDIGIVQDELVKLGFIHFNPYISCLIKRGIMIDFDVAAVKLLRHNISFNYESPRWQEDLITYVKGIINDMP